MAETTPFLAKRRTDATDPAVFFPKCSCFFQRLETHLRVSASCREIASGDEVAAWPEPHITTATATHSSHLPVYD